MQESNSFFTSDSDVFLLPIMLSECFTDQVAQRHSAPTPHIRHVAPWRLGYKHVSSTNFSTFDFSFQDVEATAEWRAPSPHSKARRSEGGTEARVTYSVLWIDSTRATTLFA
jgi:hypothetical protein